MSGLFTLGPWTWMILAAILFALEVMSPGIFLMWFGMAAAVTSLLAFAFEIGWQWQLVWFCVLSLAAVLVALKYLRNNPLQSDRPLLNEPRRSAYRPVLRSSRSDRERAGQRQDRRLDLARGGA
jgi:membrane protein implicated in regulation of membrane protease activity